MGFRYATHVQAEQLKLSGWVRNREDGTVEIVAMGSSAAVDSLITWVHDGPPGARVTAVDLRPYDGDFTRGFSICKGE